jgi:hypothetical protein
VLEPLQDENLDDKELLRMKFVFDDITHVGRYCMRLSINR